MGILIAVVVYFVFIDMVVAKLEYVYEVTNETLYKSLPYAPTNIPNIHKQVFAIVDPLYAVAIPVLVIGVIIVVLMYTKRY